MRAREYFVDSSAECLGGKADGLQKLEQLGMNVPSFFIIGAGEDIQTLLSKHRLETTNAWAVRSSADVEDGTTASFAGQFNTILNVSSEDLHDAVKAVKAQASQDKGLMLYATRQDVDINSIRMNVIVQEFIEPDVAGVWMGAKDSSGILEWVHGRGSGLVDGTQTPNREKYSDTNTDSSEILVDKNAVSVAQMCMLIEESVGYKSDIEFCIKDGVIYWLQLRPITVDMFDYTKDEHVTQKGVLEGIVASKGMARALAFRYDQFANNWQEDYILVTKNTEPKDMDAIMTSTGIITENGGILSHAAVVSREFGIPCLLGVDIGLIPHESSIELDGNKGIIRLL